tara:strand:+ start:104 stop:517 length:414 start_codon:yes stop_codon:yes gene_type:complete
MKNNYKLENYSLYYKLETRWRDLDAFQHVNNAEYATYIETARVDLFKRWGIEGTNKSKSIIMASLKIDYLAQLKHPSSMTIGQRVSRVGSTSFDIESVIFDKNNNPVCYALVVAVCFDFDTQKPVEVYDSIKDDFNG